jgi:hypothetical protein
VNVLLMPAAVRQAPLYRELAVALRELGHRADLLPIFPRTRGFLERAGERCLDFAGSFRACFREASGCDRDSLEALAPFELALARPSLAPRLARAVAAARCCLAQRFRDGGYQRVVLNNGAGLVYGVAKEIFAGAGEGVVWHTEAGFLPDTLVLDRRGVNRHGSLMTLDPERLPDADPGTDDYLADLLAGRVVARPSPHRFDGWRGHLEARDMVRPEIAVLSGRTSFDVVRDFLAPKLAREPTRPPDPEVEALGDYVFVPLQVHDDTQVVVNSERIRDMAGLVAAVARALPAGPRLVVKPHPMDRGRAPLDGVEHVIASLGERGVMVRERSSLELVRHARAVVTLNSTVGLEGLLHGRPVATLAAAWYAKPGLATPIETDPALAAWLASPSPPDLERVLRLVSFLRHHYLVPGGFRSVTRDEARGLAERVLGVGSPASWAAAGIG